MVYEKEKNRFECTCIGAGNKAILKSLLTSGMISIDDSINEIKDDIELIKESHLTRKQALLTESKKLISDLESDKLQLKSLFNKISNMETCGE